MPDDPTEPNYLRHDIAIAEQQMKAIRHDLDDALVMAQAMLNTGATCQAGAEPRSGRRGPRVIARGAQAPSAAVAIEFKDNRAWESAPSASRCWQAAVANTFRRGGHV
jgi:hypothetical protein